MKITYIHHSGFLAETNQALLLFDFAGGILPPLILPKRWWFLSATAMRIILTPIFLPLQIPTRTLSMFCLTISGRTGCRKSIFQEHTLLIQAE